MRYAFTDCVLDTACRELYRAGEVVQLEPKVYQVLAYLVQHAGPLVTQEELLEQIWPEAIVQPIAIARSITAIRRAVGDSSAAQRVIQTRHGQGYRFVAPVTVLDAAMPPMEILPPSAGAPAPPVSTLEVPIPTTDPISSPPEAADEAAEIVPPAPLQDVFVQAQQVSAEAQQRLAEELAALRAQQVTADQRRRELIRKRVVGPVPSVMVQHFQGREGELRFLGEQLTSEQLRLMLISGRGGMGKTALLTKFLHDLQGDFTLRAGEAIYEVDSVVYVPLRQSEACSPDTIVEAIGRTLEPDAAAELRTKWQGPASLFEKLEFLFRRTLRTWHCLIVLDNLESVLDQDNHIRAEFGDLRHFVETCLEWDHGVRLVATSRSTLVLSTALEGHLGARRVELRLDEGLPEADAVALLRELDSDGRLGIQDASDAILHTLAHRCAGIPRTLETLIGTLRQRRTWTLARLLAHEETLARLLDNPARELYESLTPDEQLVMQALAVYDRPVPAAAIRSLLPRLPVEDLLDALVRNYVVTYDREHFSLHPLDQRYAYHQIPAAEGDDARPVLHTHAAAFFRTLRKPQTEWQSIDDLEPQLH